MYRVQTSLTRAHTHTAELSANQKGTVVFKIKHTSYNTLISQTVRCHPQTMRAAPWKTAASRLQTNALGKKNEKQTKVGQVNHSHEC